jgi:hypothetical protein
MNVETAAVLLGLVLVGGVAYLFFRPRAVVEEELHCNCPQCDQRLRYKKRRAGAPAMCPRCCQRFKFPKADGEAKRKDT